MSSIPLTEEVIESDLYETCTAFRDKNLTKEEQDGVSHLFEMMSAAKQQIMLGKALRHE